LGASNRALEKAVLKTTAAFLNSDGGKLLIGVNDTGEVAGIESDYQVIQRGDRDGFENHFTQVFKSMIDVRFRRFVRLKFKRINGREICVIAVSPAPEPVFLKTGEAEEFFIRTGNTTSLLSLKQALDYINRHFV
jgi:predicted HTH transcriptional regulator